MDSHSGDTKAQRFFAFWGALLTFFIFGLVGIVLLGFQRCTSSDGFDSVEAERRGDLRTEVEEAQQTLAGTWKKDGDFAQVPVAVAFPAMVESLKGTKAGKTSVPVPGTKPFEELQRKQAEEAAAAAKSAAESKEAQPADTNEAAPAQADGETPAQSQSN